MCTCTGPTDWSEIEPTPTVLRFAITLDPTRGITIKSKRVIGIPAETFETAKQFGNL